MKPRYVFFALFASLGTPGRFNALFLQAHDQTASQIGLILSVNAFVSLLSSPLLCRFADTISSHELLIIVLVSVSTIVFMLQALALPAFDILPPVARFPWLLFTSALMALLYVPIEPIFTASCVNFLRREYGVDGHERYGRERLWGAASWGVIAIALGLILDTSPYGIAAIYGVYPFLSLALILTIAVFRFRSKRRLRQLGDGVYDAEKQQSPGNGENSHDAIRQETTLGQTARLLLLDGGIPALMFFALVMAVSLGMNVVKNMQFLYFVDELNASNFVCGLSVAITVIFEIPLFAVAPMLLQRFGPSGLSVMAAMAYGMRVIAYACMHNVWTVLLVEPLHGVTYAAITTASVAYVAQKAGAGGEATAQGVLTMVMGFGSVLGAVVSGVVLQVFGGRVLYFGAGVFVLAVMAAFLSVSPKVVNGAERVGLLSHYQNAQDSCGSSTGENTKTSQD